MDPRVTPAWILSRHPNHQASNLGEHCRSAQPLPSVGPFPRNQLAVPPQNGIWRDDGRDVLQHAPSESVPKQRETTALIIVQPQPPATQLRLERPVLFAQERDDVMLLALEPSQQCHQQHLQRNHRAESTLTSRPP